MAGGWDGEEREKESHGERDGVEWNRMEENRRCLVGDGSHSRHPKLHSFASMSLPCLMDLELGIYVC